MKLDWYDYGARFYNPQIGRWHSVDLSAEKFFSHTPYGYVENNPMLKFDPNGQWSVAVHYRTTYKAMINLGYSKQEADRIAYYSSTYADQPDPGLLNFAINSGDQLKYGRYGVAFGKGSTANSQNNDMNSQRHAMRSDDEAEGGMSKTEAIERGINFAWDNILSGDEKSLGVGLHALQDVSAHQGASNKEHLGSYKAVHYLGKDVSGFAAGDARRLTQGAMTLHGIVIGNEKIINKAKDKEGNITIKLQGGLTQEAFDKICKSVNNSNFQGNVRIQFQ